MNLRIVSGRKVNRMEQNQYESYLPWKRNMIFPSQGKKPYAKHIKKQVTLRLGVDVIEYFKKLAEETGVPYQNLVKIRAQRTRLWFALEGASMLPHPSLHTLRHEGIKAFVPNILSLFTISAKPTDSDLALRTRFSTLK